MGPRLLLLIAMALPTGSMAQSPGTELYVTADGLNLRAAPRVSSDVVKVLPHRTKVVVRAPPSNGWVEVNQAGTAFVGFVSRRHLGSESPAAKTRTRTRSPSRSSSRDDEGLTLGNWLCVGAAGALWLYFQIPARCDQCGNELKRNSYVWEFDGKKKRVCPECNRTYRRRNSSAANRR